MMLISGITSGCACLEYQDTTHVWITNWLCMSGIPTLSLAAKASVLAKAAQRARDLAKVPLFLLQLAVWLLVYPLVCPCVCQHPRPFIKALWDMHVLTPYSCMSPGEYMC